MRHIPSLRNVQRRNLRLGVAPNDDGRSRALRVGIAPPPAQPHRHLAGETADLDLVLPRAELDPSGRHAGGGGTFSALRAGFGWPVARHGASQRIGRKF